jgi:hypothetical protein
MKVTIVIGLIGIAACDISRREPPASPIFGVGGMIDIVSNDRADPQVADRIARWNETGVDCAELGYPAIASAGFELVADLAPQPGRERVLASYAGGIVILDHDGELIASAPGYRCSGSLDDLEQVAVGTAHDARTLVLVGTTGGRAERSTWVAMFRVTGRRLDPVFTGVVEERHGNRVRRGSIAVRPDDLIHTPPGGEPVTLIYDPDARAYLVPGAEVVDRDHDGPSASVW